TCILIDSDAMSSMGSAVSLGIMAGLLLGKPFGILLFSYLTTVLRIANLPSEIKWKHIVGAGILAGIGFTMSIFIALLAFNDPGMIDVSKLSVLLASFCAGVIGFAWLKVFLGNNTSMAKT